MAKSIRLTIDGIAYSAKLNDSRLVELMALLSPLVMPLRRHADCEYYGVSGMQLPVQGMHLTTDGHAGGLYCYAGWGTFTVLFGDADFAPYEAVHLGDINEDILSHLKRASDTVTATIEVIAPYG